MQNTVLDKRKRLEPWYEARASQYGGTPEIVASDALMNHLGDAVTLPSDRLTLGALRKKYGTSKWCDFLDRSMNPGSAEDKTVVGLEQEIIFTIADGLLGRAGKGVLPGATEQEGWEEELSELKKALANAYVEDGLAKGKESAKHMADRLDKTLRSACEEVLGRQSMAPQR